MIDYRDILEQVSEGVYLVDRDRYITFWNKAASEITGHAAEAVLGRQCQSGPLRHVDGDGRILCQDGCPLASVLEDGRPRKAAVLLQHRERAAHQDSGFEQVLTRSHVSGRRTLCASSCRRSH